MIIFFFKQKTAYEILIGLVGSEMCIRDRTTRVSQEMERKINAAMEKDNCQSRNEFLEKALKFYCDYLAAEDVSEFLPPVG